MPVLKNARRERLAQGLAAGKTQNEAYREAGYSPHKSNAARMAGEPDIQARVAEIQDKAADKAAVTIASVTKQLQESFSVAKTEAQPSAMVSAALGIAKVNGLLKDTVDLRGGLTIEVVNFE